MKRIDLAKLPSIEANARLAPNHPLALAKSVDPANLARFKTKNGEWRDADTWPKRKLVFTCTTEGCKVRGVPYEMETAENVDGVVRSMCGQCEKPHEDIRIAAEEAVQETSR